MSSPVSSYFSMNSTATRDDSPLSATDLKLLRTCWLAAMGLLIGALLPRMMAVSLASPSELFAVVDYLTDDAYYYLGIAANLAESGRSTLDGVTLTNGYHPLWLLILAALAKIAGTAPWSLFRATFWLISLIAIGSIASACLWRKRRSAEVALLAAIGLAVTMLQNPTAFLSGMEPIMVAPLFVPLVVLVESGRSPRSLLALSGVLALLFISRIDALVIFGAVAALVAVSRRFSSGLPGHGGLPGDGGLPGHGGLPGDGAVTPALGTYSALLRLSAITLPVVGTYLVVNQFVFHSSVPVSGLAKSLGGPKLANWGIIGGFLGQPKPLLLLVTILAILAILEVAAWRAGRQGPLLLRSLCVLLVAAVVQAVYYCAFSTWPIWPWYTYLTSLVFAVLIARLVYLALQLLDHRAMHLLAIASFAALALFTLSRARNYAVGPAMFLVSPSWRNALLTAPGSRWSFNRISVDMLDTFFADKPKLQIAMGDRAGGLAFWGRSKVSIVQAEGLTLDVGYLTARQQHAAERYFESNFNIRYWIVDRNVVPLVVPREGGAEYVVADPIQGRVTFGPIPTFCFPERALLYRRRYGQDATSATRFVFSFPERQACSAESRALIADTLRGIGLRQLSLPEEYDLAHGGLYSKPIEDRDRGFARSSLAAKQQVAKQQDPR
jgi:hypothetical protein